MKILAIVVTYNAMQWADRCFGSLFQSSVDPDVYVVDNGSTDGTQKYIEERFPKIIFRQSDKNLGFGKANNLGLQYALDNHYDYVYLLNQDAWIFPNTLDELIKISNKYPNYGLLSPFQMESDIYHIDYNFMTVVCASNLNILCDLYNNSPHDIYPVSHIMAAHWFMTNRCIKQVGGFSPSFPHNGEDDNYTDRIRYKGIKIGVVPSLRVVHDRGNRVISKEKQMYLEYTESIRKISRPIKSNEFLSRLPVCSSVLLFLKSTIKYRSIKPLSYMLRIIRNYSKFKNNKITSMTKECPFLGPVKI